MIVLSKCEIPFCSLCSGPGGHDEDEEGEPQEPTEERCTCYLSKPCSFCLENPNA